MPFLPMPVFILRHLCYFISLGNFVSKESSLFLSVEAVEIHLWTTIWQRHVHGSEITQIWDPYSGNGSGDTALINAAMIGA